MRTNSRSKSGFINSRNLVAILLCAAGISLAMVGFGATPSKQKAAPKQQTAADLKPVHGSTGAVTPSAASPAAGTLTSANIGTANALNWADTVGSATNETFFAGMGTCAVPMSCSTFTLTIDPSVGTAAGSYDPTKYSIFIELSWPQAAEDYDTFVCTTGGTCVQANILAQNTSTADPETISLPTTTPPGVYTVNAVMATGAFEPYTGTVYLKPIPQTTGCTGNCTPPRYMNYPAGLGQGDGAGEPSIGIDWNPNVASLKDTTSPDFTTGIKRLNTGGVAFATMNGVGSTSNGPLGEAEWRVNFDDCTSPAINVWEDVSAIFAQESALIDPIGFVDHYSNQQLGLAYPEPHTPGRVFQIELIGGQGNSQGAFSDNDGNSYLPGGNGGPGQGPDHETLGGGPYNPNSNPPPPPQVVAYGSPNAIYYCSQDIVGEAQCSRSDNGGQTFGPGIPIFQNPANCTGGIHGHVKVAPDGTVYVPNSSCGTSAGLSGVAVSQDNGLTWTENNVTGSFGGSQDPSVGVGQNNVGKVGTTNTIYVGYIDGGHPHIADSHDRGLTWEHNTDVGVSFGITHAVFPVVVAGDDNRAAFGFLGTGDGITDPSVGGTCDPYGATVNCENIWHLYIATTYDGGANWITIDATPNDPVQKGTICLQGTTCPGPPTAPDTRNLLDFNDFNIDAEGRGLLVYADGCVNCDNVYADGGQSGASHATIARQSGGRRLFSHFDPIEPMPPASPQMVSVTPGAGGALLTWLEPDNGGSPITGYNIYRSGTSAQETFLAHVSGETTTKYLDPAPLSGNDFYYVQAVNAIGEGDHCGELSLNACLTNCGTKCTFPYLNVAGAGSPGPLVPTDPTMGELTIEAVNIGDPFSGNCNEKSITFLMKVKTLDAGGTGMAAPPPNGEWQVVFGVTDTNGNPQRVFVDMDTQGTPQTTPEFSWGREDTAANGGNADNAQCTAGTATTCPSISGTFNKDGTIIIKLDVSAPFNFTANPLVTTSSTFTWDARNPGTILGTTAKKITGVTSALIGGTVGGTGGGSVQIVQTSTGGTYTTIANASCDTIPPVAGLTATPIMGNAPLTVNFDGSTSHEPVGACGTIDSYTIDFGDGDTATQTCSTMCPGGAQFFTHTYTSPGNYDARLTVKNTNGLASVNPTLVTITVASVNPPVLSKVESWMTHDSIATPFKINLPLTGTRGVECRSSSSLGAGNYQMVFTFVNNLVSVDGATLASGSAGFGNPSVIVGPNAGLGLSANQCMVNLTGVSNQQYLSIALINAKDTTGAIGTVIGPQMGVLIGDVDASGRVDGNDVSGVQSDTRQSANGTNYRFDVNADGRIDGNDVSATQGSTRTGLPSPP
jgi:PKD repeat protein